MKNLVVIACMAALSLLSTHSNAENTIYLGIAAGATSTSVDEIDEDTSSKIFVGFRPDKNIVLEASLYTTGEAGLKAPDTATTITAPLFDDVTVETSGLNLSVLYVVPNNTDLTTAIGAGVYRFETEIRDPSLAGVGNSDTDSFGASLHGRIEYEAFKALVLRLDLDVFLGVDAFDENKTVTALMAGIAYTFLADFASASWPGLTIRY